MVEKVFCGLLGRFPDFREFIEAELGPTEARGPHYVPGCALVPSGPLLCLVLSRSFQGLLSLEKISKKFCGNWTSYGIDILQSKKQAKNSN